MGMTLIRGLIVRKSSAVIGESLISRSTPCRRVARPSRQGRRGSLFECFTGLRVYCNVLPPQKGRVVLIQPPRDELDDDRAFGSHPPPVSSLAGRVDPLDQHGRAGRLRSRGLVGDLVRASATDRMGGRVDRGQRTGPGVLDRLSQPACLRPMVGSPQALGPAHQRKPQSLSEGPIVGRRSRPPTAMPSAAW